MIPEHICLQHAFQEKQEIQVETFELPPLLLQMKARDTAHWKDTSLDQGPGGTKAQKLPLVELLVLQRLVSVR